MICPPTNTLSFMNYSSQRVSPQLLEEIKTALDTIRYGSIEIYVQDKQVTQITIRSIKKTKLEIDQKGQSNPQSRNTQAQNLQEKIKVLTLQK